MTTRIINEINWALLEFYPDKIITLNKGDTVILNENNYIVKHNILDLDNHWIEIIVNEGF